MELRHLRYFVAVAEELHFARAAERLNITPPSLTQQIQNLEADLGVRLLNRSRRSVSLTDAGTKFLEEARKTVRQAENAVQVGRQAGRGEIGSVEVGYMTSAICTGVVARVLGEYHKLHPRVDIHLSRLDPPNQLLRLAENRIDIGFLRPPERYPIGLTGTEVWRQRVVIAVSREHPLATQPRLSCRDLANEEFIIPSHDGGAYLLGYVNSVGEAGGFVPHVSQRANDYLTIVTLVAAGFGIAAVPASFSRIQIPGVCYVEMDLEHEASMVVAYRRHEAAPAVRRLIQQVRKAKLLSA